MLYKLEISKWLKNTSDANFDKTGFCLELKKQTENAATKYGFNKKLAIRGIFEVSANANPSLIKILYKGQENISIDEVGNAVVKILPGEIVEKTPECLQNGKIIESGFEAVSYTHLTLPTILLV